jgi:hypothetical protein
MTEQINTTAVEPVSPARLWFGFAGSSIAWILAGVLNALLAWQACMGGEAGSFVFTQTGIRILLGVITFTLLALAIASGLISYENWQKLSRQHDFVEAEGRGRKEFMALVGVFVSATMVAGIIWFAIPIYVIRMCVRAR